MIKVGMKAPDFSLYNSNGEVVSLSDFLGKKVILYFYSKDNTSGCTKQAQAFAEKNTEIESKNAVVIGISKDTVSTHKKFEEKHGLNFILLADPELVALNAYGVWQEKKMCGKTCMGTVRTTFIIDEQGNVENIMEKVKPETNALQVCEYLGV